jgi:hypothetical protein
MGIDTHGTILRKRATSVVTGRAALESAADAGR